MWSECPQVLDASVTLYGFELDDFMVLGSGSCIGMVLLPLPLWIGATVGSFAAAYYGKRGKPSGAILHWLQAHECIPWWDFSLPGFIPTYAYVYTPW